MARALFEYPFQFDGDTLDLDRVGRDITRHYIHAQIARLNEKIEQLIFIQTQASWYRLERAAWSSPEAAEVVWAGRLELHYLQMMRESLLEQLRSL